MAVRAQAEVFSYIFTDLEFVYLLLWAWGKTQFRVMTQFTLWSFKSSLRGSVLVSQPAGTQLKNKQYPCDFSRIKEFLLAFSGQHS